MAHLSSSEVAAQPRGAPRLVVQRQALAVRVALTLGVLLLALLIRWPYLGDIPRYTDETHEMRLALDVAQGAGLPLYNVSTFIGIVHLYLVAGAFRVFGPDPFVARAVTTILGAALAGMVAWLAWAMADCDEGRRTNDDGQLNLSSFVLRPSSAVAALVAGLLAATSFMLTIASHIAWSNSTTPLFSLAAIGATWVAVALARPDWLVAAGCLWGMALQSHPAALVVVPGVALWYLWQPQGRAWLRTRWLWLGLAAFAVGYSNLLWVILTQRGQPIADASGPRFGLPASLAEYGARLAALVVQLGRMLAGSYAPVDSSDIPLLITPAVPLLGGLAIFALIWTAGRRETAILPLVVVTGGLLLAATTPTLDLSRTFAALYDTRYLSPLLPLIYLALGLAAADLRRSGSTWGRGALAVTTAAFCLVNLLALASFYRESMARGLINAPFGAVVALAHTEAERGTLIILDRGATTTRTGGGGDTRDTLVDLMAFTQTPYEEMRVDKIRYYLTQHTGTMLLLLGDQAEADLADFPLSPMPPHLPGFSVYLAPPAKTLLLSPRSQARSGLPTTASPDAFLVGMTIGCHSEARGVWTADASSPDASLVGMTVAGLGVTADHVAGC